MFKCQVCGFEGSHTDQVSEVFNIEGKLYLVESIPATVCDRCGEETFSKETTERIRLMLHSEDKPLRSVPLNVFSYSEAV
ncbi:YgiT-type zinc finger protein [cf. Phormidesmis sp. LEGE 11477]|uniref:YgiT-type zinc finger protein n=1 Tax=cf. Phormidesmis sp. LEGE 11477 TaxID=1828680 RepID=UPI00188262F3|nr:YgiT-type zinc finger protein [cf. Phormidesmis sp. LEGE 11477]MBE9062692.1 YgiT-type zinc finger protein [cf. Phormidesmis sp. LEGE 11477]